MIGAARFRGLPVCSRLLASFNRFTHRVCLGKVELATRSGQRWCTRVPTVHASALPTFRGALTPAHAGVQRYYIKTKVRTFARVRFKFYQEFASLHAALCKDPITGAERRDVPPLLAPCTTGNANARGDQTAR